MRPILMIGRVALSAAAGYAFVWAFSAPASSTATPRAADPGAAGATGLALRGDAPEGAGSERAAAPATITRIAPPFAGLEVPDAVYDLARAGEPLRLEAEQDVTGAWVIGYGRRLAQPPPRAITEGEAEAMLREDVAHAEQAVRTTVRIPLSVNEFGALVDFARSIGPENFPDTLVADMINADDREAAAEAFLLWSRERVDGSLVELDELAAQRERTRALFLTGSVSIGS